MVKVAVSGAAGQISYALLSHLLNGSVFKDEKVDLNLLEIQPALESLNGVIMELYDSALPYTGKLVGTADPNEAFKDVDYAILVGAMPRKEGMDRKDLLKANVGIFKVQGTALNNAKPTCQVLVVGNPANTNALVAAHYCTTIPKSNFTALTKLDENRAKAQIALKLNTTADKVKNVVIYGNHSNTQVPDPFSAFVELNGKKQFVKDIVDASFLKTEFMDTVITRGAAVIKARKLSSAMSAAKAIADHVSLIHHGTPENEFTSMGVYTQSTLDLPDGLIFSLPVVIKNQKWSLANVKIDPSLAQKYQATIAELSEEKKEAMAFVQ